MTSAEIRQSFLDFFASHGHTIVPSSSLLPSSPGLLFTNAGMNQFVPIFLGDRQPDVSKWAGARPAKDTRAADTQKCIRAGGKHNDLEDVGFDTYHHTMFEMLGNWSFGDYFKKESLTWGWELITKVWGIPPKRLFATVYQPDKTKGDPSDFDQEAYDIWAGIFRTAGLDPSVHIVNGGKKDNFWMMGDTGPCGPCSEIHFNLSPADDETAGRTLVNAGVPRCIEIWNHVFIQFNANADGTFSPLAAKHVDTGMGFERVAGIHSVTKGFTDFTPEPSNYAADIFSPLFAKITELSGKTYLGTVPKSHEGLSEQENTDVAFRVLADHARCVSCAIADGILPSNDGRNYVVRRILRRGILYGKKLGLKTGFFEQLVESVVASLGSVFPELKERQGTIRRVIRAEEESFGRTIDRGLALFDAEIARIPGSTETTRTPGSAETTRIPGSPETTRTPGNAEIARIPGSPETTRTPGNAEIARIPGSPETTRTPGSARVPRAAAGVPPDAPQDIRYTKRRLPHFERPWGKYHVTFSTANRAPLPPAARQIVLDSIVHGHVTGRYHLYAACVMADHVHVLIEPQPKETTPDGNAVFHPLANILHSVKSFTAHEINKALSGSGPVWEKESFDRLIRSETDLQEKFLYIVDNPRQTGLVGQEERYPFLWTPEVVPGSARVSRAAAGVSPDAPELRRDAEVCPRDAGAPPKPSRNAGAPLGLPRNAEAPPGLSRDAGAQDTVPGSIAFLLYDTYGFPLDMTQLLALERGLTVDTAGFERLMDEQRKRGRAAQKKEIIVAATEGEDTTEQQPTKFLGYTQLTAEAKVIDVVKTDKDTYLVFDQTPFYAEMGGQAGDHGAAEIAGQVFALVYTVKDKSGRYLHKLAPACALDAAKLSLVGQTAQLVVSPMARRAISRHHTAAHLIHWALRKVLGTHVHQAGTSKTKERLRFDFAHFEQVKPEQLRQIERLVNDKVLDNARVEIYETEFDKKPADTLAFFGEKYGKIVRVVDIGGYSRELCGGTHVTTTGEIGLVKIVAEMAIAAGTRRIEAVAGQAALDLVDEHESTLQAAAARLHTNPGEVDKRLEALLAQNADLEKQLLAIRQKESAGLADALAAKAVVKEQLKYVSAVVTVESPEALRSLGAQVLSKLGEGVVQLGAAFGEKATVVAFCSPAAIKAGCQAGKLVSELSAKLGGKGGGKPDFAMGGGKEPGRLAEVLKA